MLLHTGNPKSLVSGNITCWSNFGLHRLFVWIR